MSSFVPGAGFGGYDWSTISRPDVYRVKENGVIVWRKYSLMPGSRNG
jgi:hypothetical protein